MSNNKKEGTGKKVIGGIALGLVLILLGGVAGGLLQHHYKWGEDEPTVEETGRSERRRSYGRNGNRQRGRKRREAVC